ncbi:MAG: phosphotransferase [Rhodoglobus sp.]
MESLLQELAEPFERMTRAAASALLLESYGLTALATDRLDTERDDSFRVETTDGTVVLKVANPADDPAVVDLQSAAMAHAATADPTLPLQHLLPTRDGAPSTIADGRIARVLSWLDGEPLLDRMPPTPAQLHALGAALARLGRALAGFEHPAAHRALAWDLQHTASLRQHTDDRLVLGVIDDFEARIAPALDALPHQVVHNDFHPGNLLMSGGELVGILDFGDTVYTARVCDLGVALGYLVPEEGPAWSAAETFIAGYESEVQLLPAERDLLPGLAAARLAMRVVIPGIVRQPGTGEHYSDRNRRMLQRLIEEN